MLFTTIATVLVVVVALTTATFAWFSASTTAKVDSTFTAGSTSSEFSFYQWEAGNETFSVTSASIINFGDSPAGSVAVDAKGKYTAPAENGSFAFWNMDSIMPMVPQTLINGNVSDVAGTLKGMPSDEFYTATSNDTGKTLGGIDEVQANAARFKLMNNTSNGKLKVSVTIKAGDGKDNATALETLLIKSMRFLVVGTPEDGDAPSFVFGTQYKYDLFNTVSDSPVEFDFTNKTFGTAFNGGTKYGTIADPVEYRNATDTDYGSFGIKSLVAPVTELADSISATYSMSQEQQSSFVLPQGESYDIVLYVWLDGTTASDNMQLQGITFNLTFEKVAA